VGVYWEFFVFSQYLNLIIKMNELSVRAVVQFQEEKVAILFEKDLSELDFVKICLEEFGLDPEDCHYYEVVNLKLDCKIKTPRHLRYDDEFLLLRPSNSRNISRSISKNLEKTFIKETQVSQRKIYLNSSLDNDESEILDLMEIMSLKEINEEGYSERKDSVEEEDIGFNDIEKSESEESCRSEEETLINVDELINQTYENREVIKEKVILIWGAENKMKLGFRTGEKYLIKQECKVSTIKCSKVENLGCNFYLEYRTDPKSNIYRLDSYWNLHNHKLNKYDSAKSINKAILDKICELKNVAKSNNELTKLVNKKFQKNFHPQIIYHQINKMKDEEIGKTT